MAVVGGGGQAERACVHERVALPVPEGLGWSEAGGFPEVFTTAHDALFTQCELTLGERVLVHGAAGGVGIAAVQLAARAGARVVATVRNEELRPAVAEIGARVASSTSWAGRRSRTAAPTTSCSSSSAHRTSRATSARWRRAAASPSSASAGVHRPRSTCSSSWRTRGRIHGSTLRARAARREGHRRPCRRAVGAPRSLLGRAARPDRGGAPDGRGRGRLRPVRRGRQARQDRARHRITRMLTREGRPAAPTESTVNGRFSSSPITQITLSSVMSSGVGSS